MFNYIIGKITFQESNYIVIENNGIGYTIFVSNPFSYELDKETKVYLYNQIKEDEYSLYGFKSIEERNLFLKLINVKGLGPKMIMPMLATGSILGIVDAIERENILYLTKFPKIGEKLARQIILDLKGKLAKTPELVSGNSFDELVSVLESLGYKNSEIKKVLPKVDSTLDIENQVKEALKLMLK
ncbi:MAG: Holliday junction branch migration protein RuvA [Ruminococcus sp.]|nr:Holliday junction branch migration protein RuvA [Ruminococcus sp.]